MGFEDNEISFPDALPRYVEELAARFETGYTGPCEQHRVRAWLAVDHGVTVFYAHVDERDRHLLLPLGGDESDPEEVRRLETVTQCFSGPDATDAAEAFRTHLRSNYDLTRRVEGRVLFLPCQYAPALGGQPTMVLQAYANPASDSLAVGYTPIDADDVEALEACIAKNVPADSVPDFVDRLVYRIDTAVYEDRVARNLIEGIDQSTLQALGFRQQTTKPLPSSLHPEYGETEAELWQLPAGNAVWVDGSSGFVRVWRLPDRTGIIDLVDLDGQREEEVAATKTRLTS